jgi:hypothetical protein
VAGGLKYICRGILFKFAVDAQGLYGYDDAAAATVAGHELKGFQAYFNLRISRLCFPLMALVDYRGTVCAHTHTTLWHVMFTRFDDTAVGFRLIAMSLLPLTANTLVYGSSDGGNTVHDDDVEMRKLMSVTSFKLRIKPHVAGLDANNRKVSVSQPSNRSIRCLMQIVEADGVFGR